jgi:hypothetical protein
MTRIVQNSNLISIPIDLQFGKSWENLKGNFYFLTGHGPISQILTMSAQLAQLFFFSFPHYLPTRKPPNPACAAHFGLPGLPSLQPPAHSDSRT